MAHGIFESESEHSRNPNALAGVITARSSIMKVTNCKIPDFEGH